MNDIWSIIGLSSLVASVVTVVLGIVRDVLVEKYRFKREKKAEYIRSQIRLYSRIYFMIKRLTDGRYEKLSGFFGEWKDEVKELNNIMKTKADLLEQEVLDKWLGFWSVYSDFERETDSEIKNELGVVAADHFMDIVVFIRDLMNNNLIPVYRKIVGETVPDLK